MDPISAGIASGAGSAFSSWMAAKAQEKTNAANTALSREQMAFQERMSSTAHQREVNDLRLAGLNPILSATGGSGASSPSGSTPTLSAPRPTFLGDMLKDGVNTGMAAANLEADLNIKNASVAKTLADTANSLETSKVIAEDIRGRRATNARTEATNPYEISKSEAQSNTAMYESDVYHSKSLQERQRVQQERMETQRQRTDLPRYEKQSEFDRDAVKYDNIIQRVQTGIGAATSALNVSNYLSRPTIQPGTRKEQRALERAGSKGVRVKK